MTIYTSRSPFGANINAGRERNNAQERGWGPGWPNCQSSRWVKVTNGDHAVVVRREIAELVLTLFKITAKLGYDINPRGEVNQTWGAACRPIRGTRTASNHSWALAVDINSLHNPMGSVFRTNLLPSVVHAWETCGFYWGGRYMNRPDTMHMEYIGRPSDVAADLADAKRILNLLLNPPKAPSVRPPATISMSVIQSAANGGKLVPGTWQYNDVDTFYAWAVRLTQQGGVFVASQANRETWQRAIRQEEYAAAGRQFKAAVANVQRRFSKAWGLEVDGIFGPKTAAVMAKFGYIIQK